MKKYFQKSNYNCTPTKKTKHINKHYIYKLFDL